MLMGIAIVILTIYSAAISSARIDPKTAVGIWLSVVDSVLPDTDAMAAISKGSLTM